MSEYVINGGLHVDDRGVVRFVNSFDFTNVKRFYQVENHRKGFIRAWHGHNNEDKYVYVVKGTAAIGIINMQTEKESKYILSSLSPKILYIPAGNYNGAQTLEEGTIIIYFSTATVEEAKEDDIRVPYRTYPIFNENFR